MGWLPFIGCLKIQVSLQNIGLFCRALLQKRPIFLSILLMEATPQQRTIKGTDRGEMGLLEVAFVATCCVRRRGKTESGYEAVTMCSLPKLSNYTQIYICIVIRISIYRVIPCCRGYEAVTICSLPKLPSLFCKRALQKQCSFRNESRPFREPTNCYSRRQREVREADEQVTLVAAARQMDRWVLVHIEYYGRYIDGQIDTEYSCILLMYMYIHTQIYLHVRVEREREGVII